MKKNKIGFFNKENQKRIQKLSLISQKEKELGVWNIEHQISASKAAHSPEAEKLRKENKIGFYNKELQKIASENGRITSNLAFKLKVYTFLSSNITTNLFLYDSFNEIIPADYNSFKKYNKVNGIWAIWGENSDGIKVCLDVCQTIDIGKEMQIGMRKLVAKKQNKYKEFIKYKNIFFILVKQDILIFEDRELLEAFYAIENNSIYWSPSPTQLKLIKLSKEELYKLIEEYNNKILNLKNKVI